MELKTDSFDGKDRRNGSKLKLGFSDYMKLFSFISTLAIICIGFYFRVNIGLAETKEDIKEQKIFIEKISLKQVRLDKKYGEEIVQIRGNIKNIKENIGDIKDNIKEQQIEQKEQRQLLQKIYWKLETS